MISYKFIRTWGADVEVIIDDEVILFEQGDETEGTEHSHLYFMNGCVEGSDEVKYIAIGEYEKGSDLFVDLIDVELA